MKQFLLSDWKDRVIFSDDGPKPVIVDESELFKVILAGLQPGQSIPSHPEQGAVYTILQGSGWMTVDEERFPIKAGTVIGMGNGASRGMEVETQLVFIATRTNKGVTR